MVKLKKSKINDQNKKDVEIEVRQGQNWTQLKV